MNQLKSCRVENGYKQTDLADKLGIRQSSYSMIENGKRPLSVSNAKKLGDIYGIEWWKFFDVNGEMENERNISVNS